MSEPGPASERSGAATPGPASERSGAATPGPERSGGKASHGGTAERASHQAERSGGKASHGGTAERASHQAERSAKDEILDRVRRALADRPAAPEIPRDYRHEGEHRPGSPELLELLAHRLMDYKATVYRSTVDEIRAVLPEALRATLPAGGSIVVPPGLPDGWAPAGAIVDDGLSAADLDRVDAVLTACAAACAETGTIALDASPDQGRRAITLVPDRHVCVVRADQVVQTVPELLARLDPLRPLTFISGPSATSDIELQRVEGVHGPRTLVVVLAG